MEAYGWDVHDLKKSHKRTLVGGSGRRGGILRRSIHWIGENMFGIGFALLVFMALPLLQMVATFKEKDAELRQVATMEAPETPEIEEEQPPEEEPEPEEQPEMKPMDSQLSLADLELALNPSGGGGTGAQMISDALSKTLSQEASSLFATAGAEQRPRAIFRPSPKYPPSLRGVSALVKIELVVDANGRVINPRVLGSPHPEFRSAALSAIRQWRFEPGTRGGNKVPFKIRVPMQFGTA